jgi:hypothetical protein
MKKIISLSIILIILISCKSSSKHLESGNYDAALHKSAKKIQKSPGKFEEVNTFNDAYRLAYAQDNAEVNRLKQEGNPANWSKIYQIYSRMKGRQDLAASLPPVGISYQERDYSGELSTAKNNATEYAYAKGDELMAKGNRMDSRKAYEQYKEAQGYNPDFKDVKEKTEQAKRAGMTNVYFRIEDNSGVKMPVELMQEIQNIDINELDKGWNNYDSYIDTTVLYHYSIILSIKNIVINPEKVEQSSTTESKEVEDGFNYVFDSNGNVTKDSLGNDIKIPKYKTITCKVNRFHQTKAARLSGDLEYYDNGTDALMKKEPITSDALFENFYTLVFGDMAALSPETQKELNNKPLPFPQDEALIVQAGEVIKVMTKDIIIKNKDFLK